MFSSKATYGYQALAAALLLCAALLMPLNANAQGDGFASRGISSGQAANIARSATGGKVLSVSPNGDHFRVRILKSNGVVTNVLVAKQTGQIVR
ncbi:MAG: PepSY domain-containing protein [Pseudomonadales bacterium]